MNATVLLVFGCEGEKVLSRQENAPRELMDDVRRKLAQEQGLSSAGWTIDDEHPG
jgi:hypothetical protein